MDVHVYTVFTSLHDSQLPIKDKWSHDHPSFLPSLYWLAFPIARVYMVLLPKGMRWGNPCSFAASCEVNTTQPMPLKLGDVHCLLEKTWTASQCGAFYPCILIKRVQNQAAPLADTEVHKSYLCNREQTIYSFLLWVYKQRVS